MNYHQLNAQILDKFKKHWLIEEAEDIEALNNSILASCVPDSQTFFDHVLSIMKVEDSLLSFYCQR